MTRALMRDMEAHLLKAPFLAFRPALFAYDGPAHSLCVVLFLLEMNLSGLISGSPALVLDMLWVCGTVLSEWGGNYFRPFRRSRPSSSETPKLVYYMFTIRPEHCNGWQSDCD